nr:hypothetical protein [Tanacetum cinerariifolium]
MVDFSLNPQKLRLKEIVDVESSALARKPFKKLGLKVNRLPQLLLEGPNLNDDVEVPSFNAEKEKETIEHDINCTNPESTKAPRTRGRVTGKDEPEIFGDDAIPRPSGYPRKSKSQHSLASSSVTSGSSKNRVTEFFQEQIQLDREAKKESLDRELAARLAVVELQNRNEDLKILTFNTTGMNPDDAAKIEALKEKTRAAYFNFLIVVSFGPNAYWLELYNRLNSVVQKFIVELRINRSHSIDIAFT